MSARCYFPHVAVIAVCLLALLSVALVPDRAHADGGALAAGQSGALAAQAADGDLGLTSGHTYVLYSATGSGRVLDVEGASKSGGANALLWSLNRNANQQWVVEFDADGYATLRSACSGQLLDVHGGRMASGANVIQWPSNGGANQKWKVTRNANGTYRLASAKSQSYSLDVTGGRNADGANVEIWANNSSAAQQWRFFDVTAMRAELASKAKAGVAAVEPGEYVIFSGVGKNKVLDVYGASKSAGANIEVYEYHGGAAQKFTVSYDADGYALIRNTSSGMCLDVEGASTANGANVLQWSGNGGLNQKWVFEKNPDGTIRICSALWADLSLDVHGAAAMDCANVEIYPSHENANQQWTFQEPAAAAATTQSRATFVKSASSCSQMILVEALGTSATVSFHEKDSSGKWREKLSTQGYVGREGVGQASESRAVTPVGSFEVPFAFGNASNPGTQLTWHSTTWSSTWVDDPSSQYYNTWQESSSYSGEHLRSIGSIYDYALVIGYNYPRYCTARDSRTVSGAGSAFFLHCSEGKPTSGCVSVPTADMKKILQMARPGCRIVIGTPTSVYSY